MSEFMIDGRPIGKANKTYIIGELSANHNQSLTQALRLIEVAKECGADAVKIQTYTADTLTLNSKKEWFRIGEGTQWRGRYLYDLYREAFTPWEWHAPLQKKAREEGLDFFSTPFDASAVDFLEELGIPAYKIASFELVDDLLLKKVASTGKPVILSTGMSTLGEIERAVSLLRGGGCPALALLKCTSAYPSPHYEMNLATITSLKKTFNAIAGLSDHSLDPEVPIAAVVLGASIIEKHFCLSRSEKGPDSAFSLEPAEFKAMVQSIRRVEEAVGKIHFGPVSGEKPSIVFRRSLFVVQDVKKGEVITSENVRSIRPGYGLPVHFWEQIKGKSFIREVEAGTPMSWGLVEL